MRRDLEVIREQVVQILGETVFYAKVLRWGCAPCIGRIARRCRWLSGVN